MRTRAARPRTRPKTPFRIETTLEAPMADPGPPAASAENAFAANLFEDLPARYDRLADVLSLGQNAKWRRQLVRHVARMKPRRILDVATGTAGVAIDLA